MPPAVPITAEVLPAARRAIVEQMDAAGPLSDQVERTDHRVPGPPGAPDIVVRVHVPRDLERPAPCVYAIHCGGYVVGHRSMDDRAFDWLCPRLGFVGMSVEYRLAPETPFPGPLEDCYAGLRWAHEHAAELGVDPARIGIAGASAGGGLAAALTLLARDRGELPVAFQLLSYPMIDDRQTTVSSGWDVPVWSPADNAFGWRAYLGDLYGTDDIPYIAAPARAEDLSNLPPTIVYVGAVDGFCDEDLDYAQRLSQAGVPTELHMYPGAPHGFDYVPWTEIGTRCARQVEEWLARALRDSAC